MARTIFYLFVLITSTIYAQNDEQAQVKSAVDTFFEGFHKGDTTLMKSVMMDKILLQTAYKNKEGKDILVTDNPEKLINAIANRPDDQKWDERLLDYSIQVDGNMANAWTPYEFWFNGAFSHCGVNSFQFFKDGDQWKIIYLIDTRRKANCK
ncbi:nuclear transport factor 2 family protein [Flavivirga spongiicola]|uniref:Nuclear transport factor 2 family protein n=1 Tax=Flavivirga spongiicola TaxID=421621 RepID=A0ABU7Y0T1_9FLAO|nr:nuclear transport factor 2 family protein [Flavivirga sp. MEBiC05379]MDO5980866.1 nuclear transport factor 2 family protein [Flavivirga sp. MEBiC05379]